LKRNKVANRDGVFQLHVFLRYQYNESI